MNSRNIIRKLSVNDFKARYAGSFFGIIWAFIQPLITLLVLWFVFQIGFKTQPIQNVPFFLWLAAGYISWSFFSDAFSNSSQSLMEYSFLVKKVVFRTAILPIVKTISSLYVHLFFLLFIFILLIFYNYPLSVYNLQVFYYLFLNIMLILGLSWLFSAFSVFFKDTLQVINLILQIGFWATPIFWSTEFLPKNYLFIAKLNPMFYIVQGYRDSFIYHNWFWERPLSTIYFLALTIIIFITGAIVFRKLRPHFADVL